MPVVIPSPLPAPPSAKTKNETKQKQIYIYIYTTGTWSSGNCYTLYTIYAFNSLSEALFETGSWKQFNNMC